MAQSISDDQILQAALNEIAKNGYAGATTRQIAATAGINEVTLFRRFGNKQKLLLAIVEREAHGFAADDIIYSGDLVADLTRIVAFYRQLMRERGNVIMMLMSEVQRQPDLLDIMQVALGNARRMAAMIARYQQAGALIEEPPMQALFALIGSIFLAGVLRNVDDGLVGDGGNSAEIVQAYLCGRQPH